MKPIYNSYTKVYKLEFERKLEAAANRDWSTFNYCTQILERLREIIPVQISDTLETEVITKREAAYDHYRNTLR